MGLRPPRPLRGRGERQKTIRQACIDILSLGERTTMEIHDAIQADRPGTLLTAVQNALWKLRLEGKVEAASQPARGGPYVYWIPIADEGTEQ